MQQEKVAQPYLQDFLWQIPKVEQQQYVLVLDQEKLPIDLNVSSMDTTAIWSFVLATFVSVFISLIGFIITVIIINRSTKAQIKSNRELIKNQIHLKKMELENVYNQEILKELTKFQIAFNNVGVYLKLKSDNQQPISDERIFITKESLPILSQQGIILGNLLLAYKNKDIRKEVQHLDIKINELITILNKSCWKDDKITDIINACEALSESIHSEIKAA